MSKEWGQFLREEKRKDICLLVKDIEWFKHYENWHKYDVVVSFKETISLLQKELRGKIVEYEQQYGVKIKNVV